MAENILTENQVLQSQIYAISTLNPELTYQYIIRDTFYQLVPSDMKQYYMNNVRLSMNLYHGYVPEFHSKANGIFSTRIGNSIIKSLSRLVNGGNIFFKNKYQERNPKNLKNDDLDKIKKWSEIYKFQSLVKKFTEFLLAGGTCAFVYAINDKYDLVPKVYRIDQFFYDTDFSGTPVSFTGFIKSYTAEISRGQGRAKELRYYYLLEKRYYRESDDKPVIKVAVKYGLGNVNSSQDFSVEHNDIDWVNLPKQIRNRIKSDYGNSFMINQEVELPEIFGGIGVEIAKATPTNTIPEVDMGESQLINIATLILNFEQAYSEMITDLYLARGKVLLPQQWNDGSDQYNVNYYQNYDKMWYKKYPYMGDKEQTPTSVQFELRAEEWAKVRNTFSELMASEIGVAGHDLFPYLRDASGSSKTATQTASESQSTIAYVEEKRPLIVEVLDKFIKVWCEFYKATDEIGVEFSSQNHINMLVTTEQVRVMSEVGFPYYDIFHKMFPDYDTAQLNEMVQRKYEQLKIEAEIKSLSKGNDTKVKKTNAELSQQEKQDKEKDNRKL